MEILKNQIDELTATIELTIGTEDYEPKFTSALKNYSKKVNLPGFRKGMVPLGMVKKMAGKAILAEEIQRLTSESLFEYIEKNKIKILGNPLPKSDNSLDINVNELKPVKFVFEIGLMPEFNLNLANSKVKYKAFQPDADYVNKIVEDYQLRTGDMEEVSKSEKDDIISGIFTESDAQGELIENGHLHAADVHFADLKSDILQAQFIGLALGSQLVLNVAESFENETVRAQILGIAKENLNQHSAYFRFEVTVIKRRKKSELDQSFFDKLFGEGVVKSEEELRNRIETDVKKQFERESDILFFNETVEQLIIHSNFNLPDDFLKRWLHTSNDRNVNPTDIEANYDSYARGIRWQLIENKIIEENKIQVTEVEAVDYQTNQYLQMFGGQIADEAMFENIKKIAANSLKDEKQRERIFSNLYNEKIAAFFKSSFTYETELLAPDEWFKKTETNK